MPRNPPWKRDEIILALDLYFQFSDSGIPGPGNPQVIELSHVLNQLPFHDRVYREETFRNSNGVCMKLSNFLRLDPDYPGKGLDAGSKLDELVWNDFYERKNDLRQIAQAIRSNFPSIPRTEPINDYDKNGATEGQILLKVHYIRERNSSIVEKKKKRTLAKTGALSCEVCGFDFYDFYGEPGHGFAECHHIVPLAQINPGTKTKLEDLAIFCANCHRMIHKIEPMPRIEQLRKLVTDK